MKFWIFSFFIINIMGIYIGINGNISKYFYIFGHEMFSTVNNDYVWCG